MADPILQLELRVLLLRHGRRKVVEVLASLGEQSVDDLEREIMAVADRKRRKERRPKEIGELIADASRARPDLADLLFSIGNRFEGRTFLPQLRDVERFVERAGVFTGKLKSRRAAIPYVVRALTQMSADELRELAVPPASTGRSDYAVLAREIMGSSSDRRGTQGAPSTDSTQK